MRDIPQERTTTVVTRPPSAVSRQSARLMQRLARLAASGDAVLHSAAESTNEFPSFGIAVFPVQQVPDWGAMTQPAQWNRRFEDMPQSAFVNVPAYDLRELTRPLDMLLKNRWSNKDTITAKLTYSTRYFGAYDIDADEYSGNHPGIDIKLAEGTPIGSVAGGKVAAVSMRMGLGRTVIVEHRHPTEGTLFSVYGHLETTTVQAGQTVAAGDTLGTVGMTGTTTAPHLHLQIDRGTKGSEHAPYIPYSLPQPEIAARFSMHPITFLEKFGASSVQNTVAISR